MSFVNANFKAMIDIQVRVHDKFSVEFKTGFRVEKQEKENEFMMNTWIFVPYSLDINSQTYPKSHFYRDAKSYVRLITPIYTLEEVGDSNTLPYMFLQVAFNELVAEPSDANMAEFEYQIKMFISITKSALRQEVSSLMNISNRNERREAINLYIRRIGKVTTLYRDLRPVITRPEVPEKALTYFAFGDEFLSNRIEHKTFELLKFLKAVHPRDYRMGKKELMEIILKERTHRLRMGYEVTEKDNPKKNSEILHRLRLLRKYIENHLFLDADVKKDGRLAEQFSVSIAAGLAMVFATAIAFSAQQKYGNFTMPLFVALVVSYMLKDRIKETARYYFASRLSKRYFDNKTTISIKDKPIGWIKEGVDFVNEEKVPEEVIHRRNRSDILESDNRNTAEKIILYRKLVDIDGTVLDENIPYDTAGINDIMRFNFSNFIMKMDDPSVAVSIPDQEKGYETVFSKFIYYINFIIQLQQKDTVEYKRFRVIISRDGIEGIEIM